MRLAFAFARSSYQHGSGAMPEQQLLDNEPGLDRFAQPHVVRDKQVDARHLQGADDGIELVVLDRDAAAEGRLQRAGVRRGDRAPSNRVEERAQTRRVVEAVRWLRQRRLGQNHRSRFNFPENGQLVAIGVVFN